MIGQRQKGSYMCYSILKGPFHVLSLLVLDEELTSVILDVGIAHTYRSHQNVSICNDEE